MVPFEMYDTNDYFERLERIRLGLVYDRMIVPKTKMSEMVPIYGTDEVKDRYKHGMHGALVDAWCLAKMLASEEFTDSFKDWIRSRMFSL